MMTIEGMGHGRMWACLNSEESSKCLSNKSFFPKARLLSRISYGREKYGSS